MAIALPPPSAPVLSTVEAVQAGGSEVATIAWQQEKVHILGAQTLDATSLERAVSTAANLSDVVRQIQAAYYVAGYPAVQVRYARVEPDLYVLVLPGKLTRVVAPEPYTAYFAGLEGADPLTDHQLEPARALASIHSDRAGENPTIEMQPEEGGTALVIKNSETGPRQGSVGAEFGNPGNRFSGRHLASYFARGSFATGDELRVDGRHAFVGLEKPNSPSEGYHEHALSWSRVTTLGLFALRGRYVGYQQELDIDLQLGIGPVTRLTGEIRQGELAWVYPLSGSFNHRWNLTSKVDYTHKDYEITLLGRTVQKQEYGSAEIGTDYSRIVALGDQRVDISAALAVRSGLGEDHTDNDIRAADFGYLLFRPSLSITVPFGESFTAGLGLAAQITDDTLPEQQQWVMGGVGNVEAYLPGVAAGDSGGLARLFGQTRFEVMGLPVTPRVFAEYGYSKLENPFEPPFVAVAQSGSTQTVIDAGVSLSVQVTRWLETRFSYAESLDESKIDQEVLDATDANMFFSISAVLP